MSGRYEFWRTGADPNSNLTLLTATGPTAEILAQAKALAHQSEHQGHVIQVQRLDRNEPAFAVLANASSGDLVHEWNGSGWDTRYEELPAPAQLNQFIQAVRQKLARTRTADTQPDPSWLVVCPTKQRYRVAAAAEESALVADRMAQLYRGHNVWVTTPQDTLVYQVVGDGPVVSQPEKSQNMPREADTVGWNVSSDDYFENEEARRNALSDSIMWMLEDSGIEPVSVSVDERRYEFSGGEPDDATWEYWDSQGTFAAHDNAGRTLGTGDFGASVMADDYAEGEMGSITHVEIHNWWPEGVATDLPNSHNPRGASAAHQPRGDIMTRRTRPPMSRARRRRLATRVERARSRTTDKRRVARRQDTEVERLERRVASLDRLLQKAERELRAEERAERREASPERRPRPRPSQDVRERRARVREIRDRLERENDRRERVAARRPVRRRAAEPVRPERRSAAPKRPIRRRPEEAKPVERKTAPPRREAKAQKREAAPKVIKTKSGKVLIRIDD